MNKLKRFLLLFPLILCGCQNNTKNITNAQIILSEFVVNEDLSTRAIELYNLSNSDIDLTKYNLLIYKGASKDTIQINLDGIISSKDTFVICYPTSEQEVLNNANQISEYLEIDGTWPITLRKGNKQIDVLGNIGYKTKYGNNLDLVRKESYLYGRKQFVEFDWIKYKGDNYSNLNNIDNPVSEDEYFAGPHLTEEDFKTPFAISETIGGGGAIEVQLNYTIDGDTTSFKIADDLSEFGVRQIENIRYNAINTPEIQHGTYINEKPWGVAAKNYTNSILNKAKHFAISTSKNHELRETFGRLMCYVWVCFENNPQPQNYYLLNLLLVQEGYSKYSTVENDENEYKEITYSSYMRNSELYAMSLGLKIHGEIDPNFNY